MVMTLALRSDFTPCAPRCQPGCSAGSDPAAERMTGRNVNTFVLTCANSAAYPAQMRATAKSAQLQIRVSLAEKAAIQRAARRAGVDMSAWVLSRLLPAPAQRFQELTQACRHQESWRFALAALSSWLSGLAAGELQEAVASPPATGLTPFLLNYIAAMVEYACARQGVAPPPWTRSIAPLAEPAFGTELVSLRLYLLTHSPPPFRRRNIFIDATVGGQV